MGSRTLRPSKAGIGAISAVLEGEDFYRNDRPARKHYDPNPGAIRAFSWPIILHAAELVRLSGTRLEPAEEGRTALSSPPGEVILRILERWMYTWERDELSRIECVKGQTGKGGRSLTSTIERREAIRSALASCPANQWFEIDELIRFMRASGIDVALVPPADAGQEGDDLWGTDELPYFSRYDGLVAIRINPLGAYCLGNSTQYTSPIDEAQRCLRVLPNRDVTALTEISTADRLALDQYFEPEADLVRRIEPEKLLSHVESGGTIEEVREYLLAHSKTPLPQTVTQLLDDIAERSRRVSEVGAAHLIECDDEALASLIAHDSHTRRHCMLAGSRHLVVPQRSEAAFKRGLKKIGFVVRWTAKAPEAQLRPAHSKA